MLLEPFCCLSTGEGLDMVFTEFKQKLPQIVKITLDTFI